MRPLILAKHLYKVRYIIREPAPGDYQDDVSTWWKLCTWVKYVEAYSAAGALDACRVELGLTVLEARRRTAAGPVLSVEEM